MNDGVEMAFEFPEGNIARAIARNPNFEKIL